MPPKRKGGMHRMPGGHMMSDSEMAAKRKKMMGGAKPKKRKGR